MSETNTTRERAAQRNKIRANQREIAETRSRQLGRSIRCGVEQAHAGQDGGCKNNGSNCLCECHDPREAE